MGLDPFRPDRALSITGATIWGTDNPTDADRGGATRWSVRAQGLEETAVIGRVYVRTNERGVLVGDPVGTQGQREIGPRAGRALGPARAVSATALAPNRIARSNFSPANPLSRRDSLV